MTIQVQLFGQLRTIIGSATIAIDCDSDGSSKLGDVLEEIVQQHPDVRALSAQTGRHHRWRLVGFYRRGGSRVGS